MLNNSNGKSIVLPNSEKNGAITIKEFCRRYGISRSKFYNLEPKDRPISFKLGRRRLISLRHVQKWEDLMHLQYRCDVDFKSKPDHDQEKFL